MEFYLAEVGGKLRDLELLIPAGNLENLKVAIDYGADAVYIGGEFFSLRAKAKNLKTLPSVKLPIISINTNLSAKCAAIFCLTTISKLFSIKAHVPIP